MLTEPRLPFNINVPLLSIALSPLSSLLHPAIQTSLPFLSSYKSISSLRIPLYLFVQLYLLPFVFLFNISSYTSLSHIQFILFYLYSFNFKHSIYKMNQQQQQQKPLVPIVWYCGWCRKGPMNDRLNAHCVYCFRQRDASSWTETPRIPAPPPKKR